MFYLDPETQKRYTIGRPFSYGDINYTRDGATHATFMSLGFTQVIPQQRPSDEFYIVSGPNADGSYNATPRDIEQLREAQVGKSRATASQKLTPTDWYYARQAELGEPGRVPAEVAQYRADVRAAHEARKHAINSCTDVVALEALVKAPAEIFDADAEAYVTNPSAMPGWPKDYEVKGESSVADYRGFYAGLLVSGVYQTIRTQAASDLVVNMNYTDFIAALADAKVGLGIDAAFQSCIDLLIPSLELSQAEYDELVGLYQYFGLSTKHTVPPFAG